MGVAQPLNDPTYLAIVPDARLHDVVAHGVPGTPMPAFARAAGGDLTDQQIQIVVEGVRRAWGRTSSDTTPRYRTDDVTPDAVRGGDVFRTACAKCHGEDGAGGEGAGSVVDRAFLSLTSDQALRTAIIAGRPDLGTPGWKDYVAGAPMTEQQISDVVAWLTSHRGQHE
jgi:mono/diheme cytochrome c family protein